MAPKEPWLDQIDPDRLVGTLVEAIRIPSPTGSEREMGEYCAERMRAADFEVAEVALRPESPNFIGRLAAGRRGNGSRTTLCFHAHTDTVPPGEPSAWTRDPFGGTVENGRVFGRGACDAKNDIAVMLTVAEILARHRHRLRGDLVLCFASGEEIADAGGTPYALASGLMNDVDFAVVGEQTECRIAVAHRGGLHLKVTVQGESAHSSIADRAGINAIYKMSRIVEAIQSVYLPSLRTRSHLYLPAPTSTVSLIQGGLRPNMVPDSCEIILDRRTLPNDRPEEVREEIEALLEDLRRADPELQARVEILRSMPAFEMDPRHPHVQGLLQAASDMMGSVQQPTGYVAGTDARHFPSVGIPAVVFGPGEFSQAHTADESVSVDQLVQAANILTLFATRMLG